MKKYFQHALFIFLFASSAISQALPLIEITVPLELTDLPQDVKWVDVVCNLDHSRTRWTTRSITSTEVNSSTGRPLMDRVVVRFRNLEHITFMPTSWRCTFGFRDAATNFLDRNNDARFQPVANTPYVDTVGGSFQTAPASP